ncbi:Hint domain-containing protein [Cognatishimia sp. MH4019]|uniref:Hint domain-containing protein n=1 Tax=Cognatishimia sp. MH4019 TaxID=2854030 RepID=UPI001CD323F8|nr:Hint domain-containing protein [Cognatishimia sp. MH4019]
MPTTFNVISLGNLAAIDPVEGNTTAENASALVGLTFGDANNPLVDNFQSFSPGSTGSGGGSSGVFDMDNALANDTFSINGGPDQFFDGTSVYNATITYGDGTTATITAVVFQDTAGNTYLAPEFSANADQADLEAGVIQSISLDSLSGNNFSGMNASRETFDFVPCFTEGVEILTPAGPVLVEKLRVGDLVQTRDNGAQPIRWIGRSTCPVKGDLIPVRIAQGALGAGLPERDLIISPQHRMLLRSRIAQRMIGKDEVLVAARKLTGLPGIALADDLTQIVYIHLLFEKHEIIFAEGAPTESLLLGEQAQKALGADVIKELQLLFPGLLDVAPQPSRAVPIGHVARRLVSRHAKNGRPLFQI